MEVMQFMINGLGERLQKLRTSKALSQKEVATALGISAAIISNYESNERVPSVENLISLARFYRCSTDYLLGFERYTPESVLDVSMLSDEQRKLLCAFLSTLDKN